MKCYISRLLGLSLFFTSAIKAKSILTNSNKSSNEDAFYLVYVNNEHGEYKVFNNDNDKNQKRDASQIFVENLIDKINALILNRKDTYKNPEKLEEIEEGISLGKRTLDAANRYDESNIVYPISSVNNRVVLYAYLSKVLADELPKKFENIIECSPDRRSSFIHGHYNSEEILAETQWNDLAVRENADLHLSMISQGKYDQSSDRKYDSNYYYPGSAGKDIDIVLLDTSFNFEYSEFNNTMDRTAKCVGIVTDGKVSDDIRKGCAISTFYHGETSSVCAAGLTHGVANKANVYGVALPTDTFGGLNESDVLGGVQYIYENLIRPYRTVVNFSLGGSYSNTELYFQQYKELVDAINEKGGIVVSSSGNDKSDLDSSGLSGEYSIPCEFSNVICVGALDNGLRNTNQKDIYGLAGYSNYGKNVTVYAPGSVKVEILKRRRVSFEKSEGTSFSSPIVAGMIANIMSDDKDVKYNFESMRNKLLKYSEGLTLKLTNGDTGVIANNGKRSIYYP